MVRARLLLINDKQGRRQEKANLRHRVVHLQHTAQHSTAPQIQALKDRLGQDKCRRLERVPVKRAFLVSASLRVSLRAEKCAPGAC